MGYLVEKSLQGTMRESCRGAPRPMLPRVLKGRNSDPFSLGGSRGELRFSFEGLRMPGVAWSSLGSYQTKRVGI